MMPSIAAMHESLHGTFRTCHDFRVESAFGSKAEVGVFEPAKGSSWRKAAIRRNVRCWVNNGKLMLALRFFAFDFGC
jgi:hypothetical protein